LAARLALTQSDHGNRGGDASAADGTSAALIDDQSRSSGTEPTPPQMQALHYRLQQTHGAPTHAVSARQMILKSALQTALVRINHDKAAPLSSRSGTEEPSPASERADGGSTLQLTGNPLFHRSDSASSSTSALSASTSMEEAPAAVASAVSARVKKTDASAKKSETDGMPSLRAPTWPALVQTVWINIVSLALSQHTM
jgi:hypothetical protein